MAFLILALLGYVVLLPRTFFATITFIAALLIGSTAFGYGILKIKTRVMS